MAVGATALLLSVSAFADQGTVTGQVVDSSTGKYLEGAEVNINDLRTTTERDGKFTLRNVPEGAQKVVVNYPGLDSNDMAIEVKPNQNVDVAVKMTTQEVITLGAFKIEGTKEGMAQAVALQKVSIESKLIAANDQFGSISEGNIGEYLKFLPGVGIVYNSNDARGVALRGLRSQFTTVAVDGTPMASASSAGDSRRFETEQVSANNIEKNEIIKTITSDMPANSTGGFVNMVTKSAFDRQDAQRIDYRVYLTAPSTRLKASRQNGTWTQGGHYVIRPNLNVNFAKRINDKIGININYSLAEIYHDSPRTAYTWLVNRPESMDTLLTAGSYQSYSGVLDAVTGNVNAVKTSTILTGTAATTVNGASATAYTGLQGITSTPSYVNSAGVTVAAANTAATLANVGAPSTADDPALNTYSMTSEQKLTHREALAGKIDYKISDATKLTLSGQWNWYDLTFNQRAMNFNMGTNATGVNNLVGTNLNVANSTASTVAATGAVGTGTGRSIWVNDNQRAKYVTGVHFNTTLSHEFTDNSKAWITGYWSQADGKYRDSTKGYVSQGVAQYTGGVAGGSAPMYTLDNVIDTPKHPLFIGTGLDSSKIFDLNNYALLGGANMRLQPQTALDTKTGVHGDYKYSFNTAVPISIQTGAAYDQAGRTIRRQQFNMIGSIPYTSPVGAGVAADYDFDYGYNFGSGRPMDVYKLYQKYGTLFDTVAINADNYRRFDEDNKAAYVRADATLFKDLLIVGGLRWEKRTIDAKAINAVGKNKWMSNQLAYDNVYPAFTFRYTPTRNWVIRGGFSRTVGDPDYSEIVPSFTAASTSIATDANLTVPDTKLKPYYVNNFDVSAEYYFSKSGVIGGSLFRKNVSGFIINKSVAVDPFNYANSDPLAAKAIADYGVAPGDFGATAAATIKTNGASSTLNGLELWYNQNLSFLPKPFDGLSLQTNFTLVDIDAADLDTLYAQYQDAVTKQINVRLSYRWKKLQVGVSTNWTGEVLSTQSSVSVTTTNADGKTKTVTNALNMYKAPEIKTKFEMSYNFSSKYIATFEIDNIGYQRKEYFKNAQPMAQQVKLSATQYVYGDPVLRIGIKGSF